MSVGRGWLLLATIGCANTLPARMLSERSQGSSEGRAGGELVLRCVPTDAEVWLDGVEQGTCADYGGRPRGLWLGIGSRRVVVKKLGYMAWESLLDSDGTKMTVDIALANSGGSKP
jgi:hypothetical protein